jgi:hypothetical protein
MGRQGIHPKEVARVVIDAINHPKPKLQYIIGKDAQTKLVGNYLNKGFFQMMSQISTPKFFI